MSDQVKCTHRDGYSKRLCGGTAHLREFETYSKGYVKHYVCLRCGRLC